MKAKFILATIAVALIAPLTQAAKRRTAKPKFTTEELMAQASQAFLDYDVELANEKIAVLRADKKSDKEAVDVLARQVGRMEEMIQRVQDIAIIDSINVDREEFFRYYRLAPSAGRLLGRAELSPELTTADETVVFTSEEGNIMIWGTDEGLVESQRLTDGSWDSPQPLGDAVNAGGIANYPFQLPDGTTLYFATDGENSLGGLDLYITQRQRDGFALPQNMGMPYNSPYDDYMLAIDEETGAGWFATDRNQLGNLITIYVFVPADTRVNINVDAPDLVERARIASLSSPLSDDQKALLQKISEIADNSSFGEADNTPDFEFTLPDGHIYTHWGDFKNAQARRLMENYVDALGEFDSDRDALRRLRQHYADGNRDTAPAILRLEKKLKSSHQTLKKLANQVIEAELN